MDFTEYQRLIIGDNTRRLCIERNVTVRQLADCLGFGYARFVSAFEEGRGITEKRLCALAEFFDVSVAYLLTESEEMRRERDKETSQLIEEIEQKKLAREEEARQEQESREKIKLLSREETASIRKELQKQKEEKKRQLREERLETSRLKKEKKLHEQNEKKREKQEERERLRAKKFEIRTCLYCGDKESELIPFSKAKAMCIRCRDERLRQRRIANAKKWRNEHPQEFKEYQREYAKRRKAKKPQEACG